MIRHCIFDLDGTLLNTLGTITYYVNKALSDFSLPTITEEECRIILGNGAAVLMRRAMELYGVYEPQLYERVLEHYIALYDAAPLHLTVPYDGIEELLAGLRADGITVAVVSNKPDYATCRVVEHFFGDLIGSVRGGRDGVPLKPDPTAPLSVLEDIGGRAEECAFIGDTATDIMTGRNMGAGLAVGVLWGFRDRSELEAAGADVTVSHPVELLDLLRRSGE